MVNNNYLFLVQNENLLHLLAVNVQPMILFVCQTEGRFANVSP